MTAGMPPASARSSMWYLPDGRTLATIGVRPGEAVEVVELERDARAPRDRGQVDDGVRRAAERHQERGRRSRRPGGVRIRDGRRSSPRHLDDPAAGRLGEPEPAARAAPGSPPCPGSVMPRASVIAAMVLAVPITMQVPVEGNSSPWIASMRAASIVPARCSAQSRRQSVHAPSRMPS